MSICYCEYQLCAIIDKTPNGCHILLKLNQIALRTRIIFCRYWCLMKI